MDFNIQLKVTDEELKEFPEEQLIGTAERIAERSNPQSQPTLTHSLDKRLSIHVRQTLVQSSVHSPYTKQTLVQPSVHARQTLIHWRSLVQPTASPPSLLTLQPKPNLVALARSLSFQVQRYVCIGVHLSHQLSQPGSST